MRTKMIAGLASVVLLALLGGGAGLAGASNRDVRARVAQAVLAAPQAVVGPITSTRVRTVYDCDSRGLGGPCDMTGAVNGTVRYSQTDNGSLRLNIRINFAFPNSRYAVFFTCGPSHARACGFVRVGALNTDGSGRGSSTIRVGAAVLRSFEGGAGYRTDHIDLLSGGSIDKGALVAGAINYFVPAGAAALRESDISSGDAS